MTEPLEPAVCAEVTVTLTMTPAQARRYAAEWGLKPGEVVADVARRLPEHLRAMVGSPLLPPVPMLRHATVRVGAARTPEAGSEVPGECAGCEGRTCGLCARTLAGKETAA